MSFKSADNLKEIHWTPSAHQKEEQFCLSVFCEEKFPQTFIKRRFLKYE